MLINEQIEQRDLMDIKNKTSEEEENKLRNIQVMRSYLQINSSYEITKLFGNNNIYP